MKNKINILLGLTLKNSISSWNMNGTLQRELDLYINLLKNKKINLTILSYSKVNEDILIKDYLNFNINIIYNNLNLPIFLFFFYILFFKFKYLKKIDIYKSNQEHGALIVLLFSKIFFKKFIFRSGFSLRHHILKKYGKYSLKYLYALINNYLCCKFSNLIFITSKKYQKYYFSFNNKIRIVPNFIPSYFFENITNFKKNKKNKFDFIYIGRLSDEKNYKFVIELAQKLKNFKFIIISKDIKKIKEYYRNIKLLNVVNNTELKNYLEISKFLILPSLYEGHSKVLIESMSLGVPAFIKKSENISDFIIDNETGLLFNNIEDFIQKLTSINNTNIKYIKISNNIKNIALNKFSVFKISDKEFSYYKDLYLNETTIN